MDDAALVSELDSLRQCGDERGGFSKREQVAAQGLRKADPLDQLHGEIRPALVFADLVNLHDVWVLELRDGADRAARRRTRGLGVFLLMPLVALRARESRHWQLKKATATSTLAPAWRRPTSCDRHLRLSYENGKLPGRSGCVDKQAVTTT